jgi:hypothetical protein
VDGGYAHFLRRARFDVFEGRFAKDDGWLAE